MMTINYIFCSLGALQRRFSQVSNIFQLQGVICGFASKVGMFDFERGLVVRFNLVDWKNQFSILQGMVESSNIFFRFLDIRFADF